MRSKAIGLIVSGLICVTSHVTACIGPTNIEGVAFTKNETFNFESLSCLGKDGINYKVALTDKGGTTVSYSSHYDPKAMVFFGNVGMSFQQDIMVNCLGIILPLSEEMLSNRTPVTKEMFDFAKAVKVELKWLVHQKVLTMDTTLIDSIGAALENVINGGIQYWTLQKNTLTYNSWYNYDIQSGVWAVNGADGVKGVNSVRGVNGCSGVQIPTVENFTPVSVKEVVHSSSEQSKPFLSVSDKTIHINGIQSNQTVNIQVVSITGRVMHSFSVYGNASQKFETHNLVPGAYLIKCTIGGLNLSKSVMVY
jgi:hypothetical protein